MTTPFKNKKESRRSGRNSLSVSRNSSTGITYIKQNPPSSTLLDIVIGSVAVIVVSVPFFLAVAELLTQPASGFHGGF